MRRHSSVAGLALAATLIAGCSGGEAPGGGVADACTAAMDGDPRMASAITPTGLDVAAFCACFGEAGDPARRETDLAVFRALADIRAELGVMIEPAAEELEDRLRQGPDAYAFTETEFEALGERLEDFVDSIGAAGGCPAG